MSVLAVLPQPPTVGAVLLGILGVVSGALIAAIAAHRARRTRNWLYHLGTAGGLLLVAGVAGQRVPTAGAPLGPWDAGINVPFLALRLTPVAACGLLLVVVCVTLVLLFDRVPGDADALLPRGHRPLEDDDAI